MMLKDTKRRCTCILQIIPGKGILGSRKPCRNVVRRRAGIRGQFIRLPIGDPTTPVDQACQRNERQGDHRRQRHFPPLETRWGWHESMVCRNADCGFLHGGRQIHGGGNLKRGLGGQCRSIVLAVGIEKSDADRGNTQPPGNGRHNNLRA